MADLNSMLTGLDDTLIAREIELRVDMALRSFPVPSPIAASYPEAEKLVAAFYQYLMREMFGATVSDTLARGFVSLLLVRAFPAGIDDASDIATTGVQGGVLGILDKVAEAIKRQLVDQYVSGTISSGADLSSWDDRVKLMEDYLKRFAANAPSGKTHKTAVQLAPHAEEVIKNHMQIASYFRKRLGT